jgi:hypothetical protein
MNSGAAGLTPMSHSRESDLWSLLANHAFGMKRTRAVLHSDSVLHTSCDKVGLEAVWDAL